MDYPANSDRGQEAPAQNNYQKRVNSPVITGGAETSKSTLWNGIEKFFGLGECRTFRDYVGALSDMTNRVYGAIDTLLGNRKYQNYSVPGAKPQYSGYYSNPVQTAPPTQQTQQAGIPDYGPYYIVYEQREKAEVVLAGMYDLLATFKNVSIGDMFDLAGITDPHGYTNVKYGWRSLEGVRVIPYGSRWVINVPNAYLL